VIKTVVEVDLWIVGIHRGVADGTLLRHDKVLLLRRLRRGFFSEGGGR